MYKLVCCYYKKKKKDYIHCLVCKGRQEERCYSISDPVFNSEQCLFLISISAGKCHKTQAVSSKCHAPRAQLSARSKDATNRRQRISPDKTPKFACLSTWPHKPRGVQLCFPVGGEARYIQPALSRCKVRPSASGQANNLITAVLLRALPSPQYSY